MTSVDLPRQPNLRLNVVANYAGKFWGIASVYIFVPVYISLLGMDAYGLISFNAIVLALLFIADAGLSSSFAREAAKGQRGQELLDALTSIERVLFLILTLIGAIFVGPSDAVSVIGFPFGMTAGGAFGVWATGHLASEPIVNFSDLPIQLIDCRTRPGQSGSPVIAYRSGGMVAMANGDSVAFNGPVYRFIGIYSGRINAESDIGIVWRASAINELLQSL